MKAFEIIINDNNICRAGLESGKGVLTTHIISATGLDNQSDNISMSVSALNSASNESLKWVTQELKVGDEILVRIIDTEEIDQPGSSSRSLGAEAMLHSKLKTYYQLKEELAEHIKE